MMKRILTLLLLLVSVQVLSQTYPISINISLPANPSMSLTKVDRGTLIINGTATMDNGLRNWKQIGAEK